LEEDHDEKEVTTNSKITLEKQRGGWVVSLHPHDGGVISTMAQHKTFDEAVAFVKTVYDV
jgi:hypothetical protein